MKKLLFLMGSIALGTAMGDPLTWTLQDVRFVDGGTASGWFVFDALTDSVGAYSISVLGGDTTTFPEFTYQMDVPPNLVAFASFTNKFIDFTTTSTREFRITPMTWMTDAGGVIALDVQNPFAFECFNCNPSRRFESGSIATLQSDAIPEPATGLLLLAGPVLLAVKRVVR